MKDDASELDSTSVSRMGDVSCLSLEYSVSAPLDKFDLEAFKSAMGAASDALGGSAVCHPKDPATADYHVHFRWRVRKEAEVMECDVRYVANQVGSHAERGQDDEEPFAETVMRWLGQFFKFNDASATVGADFLLSGAKRLSAFPLPLKTTISDLGIDAEIDGVALNLPSPVKGVERLFVLQRKDTLFVGMQSQRRIEFSKFSVASELILSKEALDKFVR